MIVQITWQPKEIYVKIDTFSYFVYILKSEKGEEILCSYYKLLTYMLWQACPPPGFHIAFNIFFVKKIFTKYDHLGAVWNKLQLQ